MRVTQNLSCSLFVSPNGYRMTNIERNNKKTNVLVSFPPSGITGIETIGITPSIVYKRTRVKIMEFLAIILVDFLMSGIDKIYRSSQYS